MDPRRLRRQAIAEARDGNGALRAWWGNRGGTTEARAFRDIPEGVIILELYRERAERMVHLESMHRRGELKNAAAQSELHKLKRLFSEKSDPQQHLIDHVRNGPRGEFFNEDPTYDRWVQVAKARQVPDDWWGPGTGTKEEKLAALKAKLERRQAPRVEPPPSKKKGR